MNLLDTNAQITLTSSVCTSIAILTTIIRLFVKRWQFWLDDACALISVLCVTGQMIAIVSILGPPAYYVLIPTFYCTVWFARLSILLTIIRLGPRERNRPLFFVALLFLLLFGILIGQMYWVCEPQRKQGIDICVPNKQIAVLKIVSDVIADLFLLGTSVQLFLVLQDKALRYRLLCLFSTCLLTTAVSFVNSSFILSSQGLKVVIIALVECNVSLIISNIPVLSSLCSQIGGHTPRRPDSDENSVMVFVHTADAQASTNFETLSVRTLNQGTHTS